MLLSGSGAIGMNLLFPLLTGRSVHSWIGPYFGFFVVALIAHAIIRHRLMDLRLVVHRSLTLTIAVTLSLVPVGALLALLWPRLTTLFDAYEMAALLAAVVTVSLLIPVTRDATGRLLDRYVYRTQVNYQRTVREASTALTRVLDLKILLPFLNRTLVDASNAEGAAVYLLEGGRLECATGGYRHPSGHFGMPATAPALVLDTLTAERHLIVCDDLQRETPPSHRAALHTELTRLNWALVIPLLSEDAIIGALVVGPKLSGDPFYPQDLDLLMTLANQAGIAIKNAQLYAQVVLANEHLSNIVSTIEGGVVAVDATGRITLFNRAAATLTGLLCDEIRLRHVSALPECLAEPLRRSLADGRPHTQAEAELSAGGLTRPILCTTSPLRDHEGVVLGAVAVFSDLTALRALETERQKAERLAYFELLAAGIAHEIKNPLVAVKTFVQLLPNRVGDRTFFDDFGRVAVREIDRVERLLERLRLLAHPAERPQHALDLRAPITATVETVRPLFSEKSVDLSATIAPGPCVILGDHEELEQLFLNLLMNALEATPPEGAVRIELAAAADRISVVVADTGAGIPSDLLGKIFDPFVTTKKQGAGLGLAICASIAKTHGAVLAAENRSEGGAVFRVHFPFATLHTPVAS